MIITLTLSFLVVVNFLLLKFSCNKTTKRKAPEKRTVIIKPKAPSVSAKQLAASNALAPTGS